jgi:FkbM family methyltransferase
LINTFVVSKRPLHDLYRYTFKGGTYPYVCRLRTPVGEVAIELSSWHDMLTVNEVFSRLDYRAPVSVGTVVDVGSNIGVSALYFLTRNENVQCHLFEPDPRNIPRLRANLAPFESRYTLDESAVADSAGIVEFGIESTGRYGGVGLVLDETVLVPCRDINMILEGVVAEAGEIDILKIDTEGLERRTILAIRPDILGKLRMIYFESLEHVEPLHPEAFRQSRRLATLRLLRRT